MAVRLESPKGDGWLVLLRGEPNKFIQESVSMTTESLEFKYGCTVKATVHISSSEWRRFMRECGVR
jgi:hypothetical protein